MLSVGEAMRRIVQSARALPVETVPLSHVDAVSNALAVRLASLRLDQ